MQDVTTTDTDRLVERMRAGKRRALAQILTELEQVSTRAPALLRALQPHVGSARVIGFTGPPGAGKSTLVNAVVGELRRKGERVAVIAVDPSSPVSGGAILGDRIRMSAALDDEGVFVRSLATRGYLGGLSPAAVRIIDAFDAAGFDTVLIETVGTGQTEIDVAEVADLRIVVAAPGLGDGIQAMKSGILEIADILVVNKADREGAERTCQELQSALSNRASGSDVPVLRTVATSGVGVEALCGVLLTRCAAMTSAAPERRRARARYLIARAAADLVAHRLKAAEHGRLDALADAVLAGDMDPMEAARGLMRD